jgi:hypothetical protein
LVIRSDQDLQLQGKLNLRPLEDIHGLRRKELTQFLLSVSVAAVALQQTKPAVAAAEV